MATLQPVSRIVPKDRTGSLEPKRHKTKREIAKNGATDMYEAYRELMKELIPVISDLKEEFQNSRFVTSVVAVVSLRLTGLLYASVLKSRRRTNENKKDLSGKPYIQTSTVTICQNASENQETDLVSHAFEGITTSLGKITDEIKMTIETVRLNKLADPLSKESVRNTYCPMIEWMQQMLSEIAKYVDEATRVLETATDRDSKLSARGRYQSQFKTLKSSLHSALSEFQEAFVLMGQDSADVAFASSYIANEQHGATQDIEPKLGSFSDIFATMDAMKVAIETNAVSMACNTYHNSRSQDSIRKSEMVMVKIRDSMAKIKNSTYATAKFIKAINAHALQRDQSEASHFPGENLAATAQWHDCAASGEIHTSVKQQGAAHCG